MKTSPCQLESYQVSQKESNRFIPTEVILLGHKRSPFCASSQVQIDVFSLLPLSLFSSPCRYKLIRHTESNLSQAGLLPLKTHENHKNYISVLTVFNVLFCSESRKGKFFPTRELSLGMNAHLVVSEQGSQRAGQSWKELPWLHSKHQQGQVRIHEGKTAHWKGELSRITAFSDFK